MSEKQDRFNVKAARNRAGVADALQHAPEDQATTAPETLSRAFPGGLPDPARPVLLAGPTASGKSALALALARAQGRAVVNADALQVYGMWRVLTARPSRSETDAVTHLLYGHVGREPYSVGHWLRELAKVLQAHPNPVIIGGTGLYFMALTEGLAPIPPVPTDVRAESDARLASEGARALLAELDAATAARIDPLNPARIQRAWEVLRATGRGLADWQADTPPPLLPASDAAAAVVMMPERAWLAARIETRFAAMLEGGALAEVRAALPHWYPAAPWARAIGAPELVAHLRGEVTLQAASAAAIVATRQYAKRQRTWFSRRMKTWQRVDPA